jgi:hypothetical protein
MINKIKQWWAARKKKLADKEFKERLQEKREEAGYSIR